MPWIVKFEHADGAVFNIVGVFNEGLEDEFAFPFSVNFEAPESVNDFIAQATKAHQASLEVDDWEVKYADVFLKIAEELNAGTKQ